VDKITAVAELKGIDAVIVVNKTISSRPRASMRFTAGRYGGLPSSAVTGEGIGQIRDGLAGKVSAFTGTRGSGSRASCAAFSPRSG
jgi:putative ribosome biogenesis GTPase RsgA